MTPEEMVRKERERQEKKLRKQLDKQQKVSAARRQSTDSCNISSFIVERLRI